MRLESVKIRGLGPFREFEVDVSSLPGPLVAVVGPNGAGKSTLLELALPGAFYRQTPTRGSLVDLATGRDGLLEVRAVNGQAYTLRHLVDAVSKKSEAVVLDADGAAVLPDSKVRSFDAFAAKSLPPPEVLFASVFAPQGASGFLGMKPGERKAVLLRVLGIERLEKLCEHARAHEREAERVHDRLLARLADEEARAGNLTALEIDARRAAEAVVLADEALSKARAERAGAEAEIRAIAKLHEEAAQARARRAELLDAIAGAAARGKDIASRLQNNRAVIAQASEIRAAVELVASLSAEQVGLMTEANAADADARRATASLQDFDRRASAIDARASRARELLAGASREAIEAAVAALPALERAAEEAAGAVGVAQDAADDLAGQRVAGAEERIAPLRKALEDIRDTEEFAIDRAEEALAADDEAVTRAQELPKQVEQAAAAVRAAREAKTAADRALAEARNLAARASSLAAATADIEATSRELEELKDERGRVAAEAEARRGQAARLGARVKAIADVELPPALALAAKAAPLAGAEGRIAELEPQELAAAAEIERLNRELAATPEPNPPTPIPLMAGFDAALASAERAARDAHAAVAVAQQRLDTARASLAQVDQLEREKAAAEAELADWTRLAADLGPNGIQAAEIDAAGPELTELVNDLLRTCVGPRFTLSIETSRLSADGKKQIEGCEVRVLDTVKGRDAEASTFSGGERVIIGEAVSLALSMLACRRAGLEGVTLVRDESGAALDPANARAYVAMLRRAAALVRADKVLFVSHSQEVIEMADSRIEVG